MQGANGEVGILLGNPSAGQPSGLWTLVRTKCYEKWSTSILPLRSPSLRLFGFRG